MFYIDAAFLTVHFRMVHMSAAAAAFVVHIEFWFAEMQDKMFMFDFLFQFFALSKGGFGSTLSEHTDAEIDVFFKNGYGSSL